MSRTTHLTWCKTRALEYVDAGDLSSAFVSLISDLGKHPETRNHAAGDVGTVLLMAGQLGTVSQMREFIEGCN